MAWLELSIDATHEAIDWVCTLLSATDCTGDVHIMNPIEPDSHGLATQDKPHWDYTIRLYLPDDIHGSACAEKIDNLLSPLHRIGLTRALHLTVVEQKPAHAELYHPRTHRIGQRFIVLTPNAPYHPETADEIPLRLGTTFSFGSGLHPATMLSLRLLERYVAPGMNVLDLGSGSGILSVAIAKLGAHVLALDNDRTAVQATQDAVNQNGVKQQVTVMEGSLGQGSSLGHWMGLDTIDNVPTIDATATFDLIVANILARIHIALAEDLQRALRCTDHRVGLLITAGFTVDYQDEVAMALGKAGFEAIDCERLNEWVAFAHRLKS